MLFRLVITQIVKRVHDGGMIKILLSLIAVKDPEGCGIGKAQYGFDGNILDLWKNLYGSIASSGIPDDVYRRALSAGIEAMPMTQHRSSDIGYIILAAVLEEHYGAPFEQIWREQLPVEATHGLMWGAQNAAATENCPIRKRVVIGEVHDLNAASMGGVSGHAGLFGDVRSVAAAATWPLRAYHGQIRDISKDVITNFWKYRGAGTHCLGWDTPSVHGSSASDLWPKYGVGHLGFTGCSLWIAVEEKICVTFLSNRVHPLVEGGSTPFAPLHPRYKAFKEFRPKLHHHIWTTLQKMGYV